MFYASMQLLALPRRTCERNNFLSEGRTSKHHFICDLKDSILTQLCCDLFVALHQLVISKFEIVITKCYRVQDYAYSGAILDFQSTASDVFISQ